MNTKYIFLDIDGTLYKHGSNVPSSAIKAIQQARKNGHKVFLCTGRNKPSIEEFLSIGFDGFILSAGAEIELNDKIIYEHPLTHEQYLQIKEAYEADHVFYNIETGSYTYRDQGMTQIFILGKLIGQGNSELARILEKHNERNKIKPLNDYHGESAYKMCFVAQLPNDLDHIKRLSDDLSAVIYPSSNGQYINGEINSSEVSKGKSIKILMDHLDVPMSETIGFGDSMNDLSMIKAVNTGVVMDNGDDELKKYADFVAEDVNKKGLYKAFKKLGLLK